MVQAIIHLDNFRHNVSLLQAAAAQRPLCLAVKANAYGHGALRIVREAEKQGVGSFGVARVAEAVELRDAGVRSDILLFTIASRDELQELWQYDIQPFVCDGEYFQQLVDVYERLRPARPLRVHIKTDTGMGRIGCLLSEVQELAEAISAEQGFVLEGIATHYPISDQPSDTLCREQAASLRGLRAQLESLGINARYYHAANSAGLLYHAGDGLDLMRPGIAAYGYPPAGRAPDSAVSRAVPEFRPVMELRAPVSFVKKVARGTPISYGHTWKSRETCWIATVNIGYGDGYPRILSNRASVLLNGRAYPQVGTICMDQCMVNLGAELFSDSPAGAAAILFGPDARGETAASLAQKAGTIPYEITCGISARVERVYMG